MKAIMYHYVRDDRPDLPYQRYLHIESFERQLEWFGNTHGFVDRASFEESLAGGHPSSGVVLTFDDALRDHHEFVLPVLQRLGLWGIFYVPTSPYRTGDLLNVHRLHVLLGAVGGEKLVASMDGIVEDSMLSHAHIDEFRSATYSRQDNDAATDLFKRTMNYFIAEEFRSAVCRELLARHGIDEQDVAARFYMTPEELRELAGAQMVIGSHSDSHPVLSKLPVDQQRREIEGSIDVLASFLGSTVDTFCYPYGGFHSFTTETEALLAAAGIRYAFNVEQRDISTSDLVDRPMALPRYDCNQFPFGKAHFGPQAPAA